MSKSVLQAGGIAAAAILAMAGCQIEFQKSHSETIQGPFPTEPNGKPVKNYVSQAVVFTADNGEFERIELLIPSGAATSVNLVPSADKMIHLTAGIVADSSFKVKQLVAHVHRDFHDHTILLDANPAYYNCSIEHINGQITSVSGACVDSITVALPEFSKTEVFLNGKLVVPPKP